MTLTFDCARKNDGSASDAVFTALHCMRRGIRDRKAVRLSVPQARELWRNESTYSEKKGSIGSRLRAFQWAYIKVSVCTTETKPHDITVTYSAVQLAKVEWWLTNWGHWFTGQGHRKQFPKIRSKNGELTYRSTCEIDIAESLHNWITFHSKTALIHFRTLGFNICVYAQLNDTLLRPLRQQPL